jgi:hypothetical protein
MDSYIELQQSQITRQPKLVQEKLELGFSVLVKKGKRYLYTIFRDKDKTGPVSLGISKKELERVRELRAKITINKDFKGLDYRQARELTYDKWSEYK